MAEENASIYPAPNADDLSSANKDGEFLQPPPMMDSPVPPLTNIHADIYNAEAAVRLLFTRCNYSSSLKGHP